MKCALIKKRYGIPAALLILLVLAGVATAFTVKTLSYTITTKEPLSFREYDGLDNNMCQGESGGIKVKAKNASAEKGYGIFVNATVTGAIDNLTYSAGSGGELVSTEQELKEDVNGDSDEWDAWYNIEADDWYFIYATVDSTDNAAPGELKIELEFSRETEYE